MLVHRLERIFLFSIYRKQTIISSYIHNYSELPENIKISVFSSIFLGALRICSNEYLNSEIETVTKIAREYQFPQYLIDKAYKSAHRTLRSTNNALQENNDDQFKNILIFPYNKNLLHLPTIFKRNFDVRIIFKNSKTIKNLLIKNSPVSEFNGCVHKIPCNNCDRFYVGQTGKHLEKRIKQHKYSVRSGQESSAIFCHVRDKNHIIDFANTRIIMKCMDYHDRNIIESAIIKKCFDKNLYFSQGFYTLDSFTINKIINHFKIKLNSFSLS